MRKAILAGFLITGLGITGCGEGLRQTGADAGPAAFEPQTLGDPPPAAGDPGFLGLGSGPETDATDGVGAAPEAPPEAGAPMTDSVGEAPRDAGASGEHFDLAYGDHPAQRLDLYGAGGAGKPVLVYVHGGAWQTGDKARVHSKAEFFTGAGYLFASVNYRLSPEVTHPGHAGDVGAAVAWILENAAEYGGDPGRVSLLGHSAGAHLAALVAADPTYLEAHGRHGADLTAVVLLDGAGYDIPRLAELNPRQFDRTYAPVFGEDPAVLEAASPITHVHSGMPPHLVLHVDREMGRLQSGAYAEALAGAGVPVEVHEVPGKSHRDINVDLGAPGEAINSLVADFLAAS